MIFNTIKDFLEYTSPCYWCGEKCIINLINFAMENDENIINFKPETSNNSNLIFNSPKLTIDFNIHNNEFKTNNKLLVEGDSYIFTTSCKCGLKHSSKIIRFNTLTNYIESFEITANYRFCYVDSSIYALENNGDILISIVKLSHKVFRKTTHIKYIIYNKSLKDFKNKEALLERIKIYLLFS